MPPRTILATQTRIFEASACEVETEIFMNDISTGNYDVSSFDAMTDAACDQVNPDSHFHILIIEDNEYLNETLVGYLETKGYIVSWARDGVAGILLARTMQPHVILTDYFMPGLHGLEMIQQMRCDPLIRDIPIVVMSAHIIHDNSLAGIPFLYKPFNIEDIHAVLRRQVKARQTVRYDG